MEADPTVRCVADVRAVLGEGPVWVGREAALYWVDIEGRKIFRLGEDDELREWDTPLRVGSIAPRVAGGFVAATDQGIALIDLARGTFEVVARPEADRPSNRFNDGKVDRRGCFWAGSMDDDQRIASGALHRIDDPRAPRQVDDGYRITNGPAFNASGDTMYVNDTALQVTYAFDLDPAGNLANRRRFIDHEDSVGSPDGMTVDAEDCLWIAMWSGWCLRRFSPSGGRLGEIRLPVGQPTSCAFGGPDLDRLYVTSARIGLDESALAMQPKAGGTFVVSAGVRGLAELPFNG
ncbi:MAG: SMP-30/gluconolactonase/LRE family protein [Sphingomicrobium sp.]